MALSFAQQSARAAASDFRAIVDAVIARELPYIMGEPSNTTHHVKRIALAQALVRPGGLSSYAEVFYRLMAGTSNSVAADEMSSLTEGDYTAMFGATFLVVAGVTDDD